MTHLSLSRAAAALMLAGAALTLACTNATGPSSAATADLTSSRLSGTWTLVAQQPAGEPEAPPPAGSEFTLEIIDGRASLRADCNRCNGAATVNAASVTLGPALACTKAFCTASAPYDDRFVRILAGDSTATLAGDALTLRSDRGTARFTR